MKQMRVGLIGAGNVAQIAQLPVLAAREDVVIAGVVTRTPQSAAFNLSRWPIEAAYASTEEMLTRADLHAVFVLTPRLQHEDQVETALRAGVDVFCEKPLATTAAEAHRLSSLADEFGRVLQVGFNRRYAPVYEVGRQAFGASSVDMCVAQKNRSGSEYRATFENAIHMVDLLRWFCGEPQNVSAHFVGEDPYEEDGLAAVIRFDTGAIGSLVAARTAGEWSERLDAYGSGCSVNVVAPDMCTVSAGGATELVDLKPRSFGWAEANTTLGFRGCVDHFLDRVRDRGTPLTSGREAALTQDLLEMILGEAGLPLVEDEDREWESHATR